MLNWLLTYKMSWVLILSNGALVASKSQEPMLSHNSKLDRKYHEINAKVLFSTVTAHIKCTLSVTKTCIFYECFKRIEFHYAVCFNDFVVDCKNFTTCQVDRKKALKTFSIDTYMKHLPLKDNSLDYKCK